MLRATHSIATWNRTDRRLARRRGVGRRSVRGSAGRCAGGNPRRTARQLRDLLPRPEAHARAAASLRPPLGRDPSASVHAGHARTIRRSSRSSRRPRTRRILVVPGTPTRCSRRSRRWARSCMRWKCRRPAATRCSPTSTRLREPVRRHEGAGRPAHDGLRRRQLQAARRAVARAALRAADDAHEGEGSRQRADDVGASAGAHASETGRKALYIGGHVQHSTA